ncbi:Proteasome subunit alpha type [Zea mays]|uniref:Proteasome subunit alpha type n=1 Tax=Zea mays TaxID=4577 RepID=A0A1D6N972_MAIZE|nr:Proteasome subunit alpha type [Zea mays]
MTCWSMPKLLLRQLLRRWMLTKKQDDMPKLHVLALLKSLIPLG